MTAWKVRELRQASDYILFELAGRRYAALPPSTPAQAVLASAAAARNPHPSLVSIFPLLATNRPRADEARSKVEWHLRQDVLCHEFLTQVFFTSRGQQENSADLLSALKAFGTETVEIILDNEDHSFGLEGPYLLSSGSLKKIYRLYDDDHGAFMCGLRPTQETNGFVPLRLGGNAIQSISVAVPSRSSSVGSLAKPLSGVRVAVKDIFSVKGIRMSACNRAYYEMSDLASQTAPSVQKLIEAGCCVVGTTKLSSMISREEPTEATDYQAPFNPRGDGYQSPAGSSSGSAAAIASYDWLDMAVGTDSTGSSRRPALVNGCFQLRLSHNATPLDGIMPCFPMFDALALFGRDLGKFRAFTQVWLSKKAPKSTTVTSTQQQSEAVSNGPSVLEAQLPIQIYYPLDYFPVPNSEQMEMINSFLAKLEATCNVKVAQVSIEDEWNNGPPEKAGGQKLREFLQDTGKNSFFYDFTKSHETFREAFVAKHKKQPYVNPVVRWRWSEGAKISEMQRDAAVDRMSIYAEWLRQKFFKSESHFPVMVLPIANVEPNYRDVPPGPPFAQDSWDALFLAPLLGAPEMTFPIGDILYDSKISGRAEKLPVALSILGPENSELDLIELALEFLKKNGKSAIVSTGSTLYG